METNSRLRLDILWTLRRLKRDRMLLHMGGTITAKKIMKGFADNNVVTPMVDGGTIPYIFGTPGSIVVTEGSFKNVPVIY